MRADLHLHSIHSDGRLPPAEIVAIAKERGLTAISLTDHDSVGGIPEAQKAGGPANLEIIPGIELSASLDGKDIHILGYFIDIENPTLLAKLAIFRHSREDRARKMVIGLQSQGVEISFDEVQEQAGGGAFGRPHIANVLLNKGYARDVYGVFQKYLGYDCPAYVEKFSLHPRDAIDLIHQAGGLAFLAHPSLYMKERHLMTVIQSGLDGIETAHPNHFEHSISYYKRIVEQYGLLESGGSDCHGRHEQIVIGRHTIAYEQVLRMKDKRLETHS